MSCARSGRSRGTRRTSSSSRSTSSPTRKWRSSPTASRGARENGGRRGKPGKDQGRNFPSADHLAVPRGAGGGAVEAREGDHRSRALSRPDHLRGGPVLQGALRDRGDLPRRRRPHHPGADPRQGKGGKVMAFNYDQYIRGGKLPHIWCPGCTYGIVFKSLLRVVDTLKPDKHVLVVSGDGDATAIGGNHFIHACRRNIDITVLVFNNYIYGMTGGQYSPTTPLGHMATTMPYGNIDPSFNIPELAKGAGASFVARGTAYHAAGLDRLIVEAIQHKGLSVVEIINACPTTHGRRNKFKSPTDQLLWMKDTFLPAVAFEKLAPEKTAGKLPMGVLYKKEGLPEYCETYYGLVERLKKQKEGRAQER